MNIEDKCGERRKFALHMCDKILKENLSNAHQDRTAGDSPRGL